MSEEWKRIVEAGAIAEFERFRRMARAEATRPEVHGMGTWKGLSEDARQYYRDCVRPALAAAFAAAEEEAKREFEERRSAQTSRAAERFLIARRAWKWLRTLRESP